MRESFEYAYRRFGCKWFVIDNLAKCGVSEDDYNGQKAVVDMLTDFARDFQVTVLLVHHTRKGQTENIAPGKMDIKGTGAITDMVDTVMTVWRNKPKEEAIQAGIEPAKRSDMEGDDAPDALLAVVKQRHGDWEGKISLWFDQGSYQFLAGPQAKPFRYVGYMSQENMQ
jgi:twinkle protein